MSPFSNEAGTVRGSTDAIQMVAAMQEDRINHSREYPDDDDDDDDDEKLPRLAIL